MHEISIAYDIVKIAVENAISNNIKKVERIFMQIGAFACVDRDSLDFAFKSISRNTPCEGAILEVEEIPSKAKCENCKEEFYIDYTNKLCPNCNAYSNNIISGYELVVLEIEGD